MLRRLATSRWVKLGLLVLALGFCAYGLFAQRTQVAAAMGNFTWITVVGAFAAAIVAMACMMLAWRAVLRDLGSPLPLPAAIRILFVSQLGKYVPGAVWAPAAQVEMGRGHDVPRARSASAAVMSMLIALATGLLTAAVALPLSSGGAAREYWWALALAPPALICLYPPLTGYLLDRALRLAKRPPLERRIGAAGMARAVGWSLLGWVFYGVHAWLLVSGVTGRGVSVLPIAAGAFALAWSVGFILIPFPGGVGPRELAFVAALAPIMPRGSAIVVAVVSRLVVTVADLTWAAAGFALSRRVRRDRGDSSGHDGRPPEPGRPTADSTPHPAAATDGIVRGQVEPISPGGPGTGR
jgi:uncharacterized membrane protein YbhN (UPF0104 family)